MRIAPASALLALFLSLPLALAAPAYGQYDAQTPIDVSGAVSVPGENPLTFCDDPGKDILTIERVDLTPNPPVPYVFSPYSKISPIHNFQQVHLKLTFIPILLQW